MRATGLLKLTGPLFLLFTCTVSNGQGSGRPVEGATGGLLLPNQPSGLSDLKPGVRLHMDPYGKPCLSVGAYSLTKPDFRSTFGAEEKPLASVEYEHIVTAKSHCSQTIKLKVCYSGSQSCVTIDVAGYGNQRASLGISPGARISLSIYRTVLISIALTRVLALMACRSLWKNRLGGVLISAL